MKFSIPYLFIALYKGLFSHRSFLQSLQCSLNLLLTDYVVLPTYYLPLIKFVIQ
nr:MAG TPA: hypothetical protein [Crassvirales sp.]